MANVTKPLIPLFIMMLIDEVSMMKKIYSKPEIEISCVSTEEVMTDIIGGSDVFIDVESLFSDDAV